MDPIIAAGEDPAGLHFGMIASKIEIIHCIERGNL
jgi:hypothetical protein